LFVGGRIGDCPVLLLVIFFPGLASWIPHYFLG
jgi:hypothetical protein